MNALPVQSDPAIEAKTPMRFTYPSGSRPLEGYTIKRGVGRGGFGEVYFAVSDAGKEVALKLIRRNLEVELRGVTHCLNLKHPNLVALYDIRTDEHEDHWVVMEYVSGESLEEVIDRYPEGMPPSEAMQWFDGVCAAVAYLHDRGIVHRDLKPANIFIDDGVVKIGDYGLSKFISCSRRSGQTESVGTVHYMAPEIANGRYGREIDVYALGIILYEMLTGRAPFEGESVGEVLMKHLTAEPNLDALAEPFRTVVRRAMAKDPEQRINGAAEMLHLLRDVDRGPQPSIPFAAHVARSDAAPTSAEPAEPAHGNRPHSLHHGSLTAFFHRQPEPVLNGVTAAWRAVKKDLNYDQLSAPWRLAVHFMLVFACFLAAIVAAPVLGGLLILYAAYRVVRAIVQATTAPPSGSSPATAPFASSPAAARRDAGRNQENDERAEAGAESPLLAARSRHISTPAPWRRRHRQASWRHVAYDELAALPMRERASLLAGSMLAAGVIGPVVALLACLLMASALRAELYLWTAVVATVASWALIVPGQLAEGRIEDQAPLRFLNLLLGAVVGAAAWLIADLNYVGLPVSSGLVPGPNDTLFYEIFRWRNDDLHSVYRSGIGMANMPAAIYIAYFAFLFVVLRWWRLAEWTRPSRVSLWATAWACFIGWGLSFFWWFPQPTGMLLAATIAFTVQLSSPWLSPSRRRELAQRTV